MQRRPDVANQPFVSLPSDPTTRMDQQQAPQGMPSNAGAAPTRPFPKDALSARPEAMDKGRESRIAGIITIFILLATLLLLGFSVYLAAELGFLSIPGVKPQMSSPTTPVDSVRVPNLIGLDYAQTKALAARHGFKLMVMNNVTSGKVKRQSPKAGGFAKRGDTIQVQFDGSQTGQTVPMGLVGGSLDNAKQILNKDGILYTVVADQNDPQDPNMGPNAVTRVDPNQGQLLPAGQEVTLFVTNLETTPPMPASRVAPTSTVVEHPTLTPAPTPTLSPTPTPAPMPTPTLLPTSTLPATPKPKPTVTL
jgi:serine/threonine-protein kinase